MSPTRRIERQREKVRRLAGELRFELLLLRRLSAQEVATPSTDNRHEPVFHTLGEVYAAAVLRLCDGVGPDQDLR